MHLKKKNQNQKNPPQNQQKTCNKIASEDGGEQV